MPLTGRLSQLSRSSLISALTLSLLDVFSYLAIGVVFLAAAAILFDQSDGRRRFLIPGWVFTAVVGVAGTVAALRFAVPASVLGADWLEAYFPHGSLSFPGALCLLFLALAMSVEPGRKVYRNGFSKAFGFLIPVLMVSFLSVVAGLLGVPSDSIQGFWLRMAWLDVGAVVLFAAYIITAPPLRWPVSMLSASYASMRLSRYYLLFLTVVPLIVGLGILAASERHWIGVRGGLIFVVFATVAVSWIIVINGASWAYKLSVARDLAVRRLEESWKARESYFRSLVDESPTILYIGDRHGNCTFLSKKWQEFTGRPTVQDLGMGWLDCVHPEDKIRMSSYAREVKDGQRFEPFTNEYRLRRWDGQYRWVISTGIPRLDDRRRFQGYMGTVIDIHDYKLHEDSLIKDKHEAELSNQTKSQFLANMSHEIRTPLNAILGFADLCSDLGCSREERIDFLKRIRCNGDHLLRLIDDILDLAKMESGSPTVQKAELSIEKILEETVASLRALASQKGLTLELRRSLALPKAVYSDPHRIKQIVTNLVGNAIKFTASGGVRINADVNESGQIEIDIVDSGIGLSPDQQKNLFKPFSQADSSVTRKYGGTGLGLHLSRKLAQSLGGNVTLQESTVGSGTTFRFTFANEKAPDERSLSVPAPVPVANRRKLYGKKILVAEDSADSRELIQLYFRSTGAQLLTADNGFEAVSVAWRERPDIILMDVQMPGMDGLEATRRLRAEGYSRPIVALTAHALQDEVDRSFEAGCNYHLTKPVLKDVLLGLVSELLQHAPPAHHI